MRKLALVTGGSGGIGEACVLRFLREGWNVVFTYLNNEESKERICEAAKKEFPEGEPQVLAIRLDLEKASYQEIFDAFKSARTYFGSKAFDAVIANAGISISGTLDKMEPEDIEKLLRVNLQGQIYTVKAAIPEMVSEKRGAVILMGSMWGKTGASCESIYSAAKAGLIGLGKSLASELGPSGVRVNVINPGVIDTAMNSVYTEEEINELKDKTPLGRIGRPEDVANACYFLASDQGEFITGQVLGVDGGFI